MTINAFASASELLAQLRSGSLSARELLEAHLARIERHGAALNAVVTLDAERARIRAQQLDERQAGPRGVLHGLSATIKDSFETAGLLTTCGAPQWRKHVPLANAAAVDRLLDAGMAIIGKTNVPIYAGDVQSYNLLFGATANPWDHARTSGGSSGGAAAAVAAGLSAFELGSDIGGSIRIPAHFCGVYGHKPTYGLVPLRGHIPPPPGSMSVPDLGVAGPIARSAADLGLLLDVLADCGRDGALKLPDPRARRLADFRIGAWLDDADFPLDDAVRESLEQALFALEKAGASVDREARPLPSLAGNFDDYLRLLWPATTAHLSDRAFMRLQEAGRAAAAGSVRHRLARYSGASHREWLHVNEKREQARAQWEAYFDSYDVLLCPVDPVCAFPHDHSDDLIGRSIAINGSRRWYWEQLGWIALATFAYLPATSAPVGRSRDGLPVGIQIIGPNGEDRTCIEFARLLADVLPGFEPPPLYR